VRTECVLTVMDPDSIPAQFVKEKVDGYVRAVGEKVNVYVKLVKVKVDGYALHVKGKGH